MTAADPPPSRSEREKLAETVKSAIVAHVPDGYDQVDIGWSGPLARECLEALAVLAQPRQECEALRAQGRGEVTAPSSQPDARTAREHADKIREVVARISGTGHVPAIDFALTALLAQVERLERERDRAEERVREAAKLFGVCDGGRYWNDWKESHRILVGRAEATEARAVQAERERDEAVERAKALGKVSWGATQRRQAAEARAQRYREALTHYAKGAGYSTIIARRALACDPLVCRDPNLCWGTGTCPRDPACNE